MIVFYYSSVRYSSVRRTSLTFDQNSLAHIALPSDNTVW